MMYRTLIATALLFTTTAGCNAQTPASTPAPTRSEAGLAVVPLTIVSGNRSHRFQVEVAATSQEQGRGLMFRTEVGPNEGMIFPFPQPRRASFWMKNTLVPLDMLFIRADGTIESIAANTIPHSLDPVSSAGPVAAVLELRGGRAAELGIKAGDRVSW